MELKNKYSKQIIYSNQKFEDQIWYNQQIMTFLNFLQLPESVFRPNFPENTFLKTKPNFFDRKMFSVDRKVFSVDQLSGKQTNTGKFGKWFPKNHISNFFMFVYLLESWSMENIFHSRKNLAWFSGKCFPENLDGKHFPEVMKNLEMSLFAEYIKFDPQTFDCYI